MRSTAALLRHARSGVARLAPGLHTGYLLARQGVLRPLRPDKLLRVVAAFRRWGITLPLGFSAGAVRHPDRPAVIDERGVLSYAEVEHRTTRLAHGLRDRLHSGERIGILCRNHHGPLETMIAAGKLGVDVVLLNTGLSTTQLSNVLIQQRVGVLVVDSEFTGQLTDAPNDLETVLAWTDGTTRRATIEHLIARSPTRNLPRPKRSSKQIVLTSGTTGTPKGARRPDPSSLAPAAAILSRMPLRFGERIFIGAPLFHTWGLAAFQLGAILGSTLVLCRKFEPEKGLDILDRHRCTSMFAVPVMLHRILELPESVLRKYRLEALHTVASSGSALPADLAERFQRTFGRVLYNFYGSTEVSWVSIATPQELHAAPGTAGRPPQGTVVRLLDEQGETVGPGSVGRIFVRNDMLFDGYTGGGGGETQNGLMATGDLGKMDHKGRLFVVGRTDDMIVSGGENVYPKETEDALAALDGVSEVAVIGVDDAEFGQRLAAFVVSRDGQNLMADGLREHVRARLSRVAVPRDVVFLDTLPRNATGKVVPRELITYLDS